MAATLRASTEGLKVVDKARRKKGWTKTEKAWVDLALTSKSTLRRFWTGNSIHSDTFKEICKAVEVRDWEDIADSQTSEQIRKDSQAASGKFTKRIVIELDTDLETIDPQKLHDVIAKLSQMGSPTIKFQDISEGSIKLLFEGSLSELEQLETLFRLGEFSEILGVPIKNVHIASKEDLVQWIYENNGSSIQLTHINLGGSNLSGVDLSAANLSAANLSLANLIEANLNESNLSGANLLMTNLIGSDLVEANLSKAVLRLAYLSEAFLYKANLSEADIREANLSGANLSESNMHKASLTGADIIGADLSRAKLVQADLSMANMIGVNLRGADLTEANLIAANLTQVNLSDAIVANARFGLGLGLSIREKQELTERGAIFIDAPGEREYSSVPVPSGRR